MELLIKSIDRIFWDAAQIASDADRSVYLARACGDDVKLHQRVLHLLKVRSEADDLLEAHACMATLDEPLLEKPGTRIGPYKLLEQIGEGGMGLVFVAEQQQPVRRKVALKVIKPGMDTKQVIARFEAERQALAIMDHPNIAKVFDGGATAEGRPFFVMELVKGKPITDYCDRNQLGTRQRLELFLDVCQAVQHAHQKGIIHRDLKPSNILVEVHDVRPVVKIIDFGIAKAIGQQLTDKTLFTGIAQMIGTPLYMSPEQAGLSSLDVDTRSDVYSLGVLLYELLTGTTPFDGETLKKAGYDEMRRIVREDEPPKPSARLSTMHDQMLSTIAEQRGMEPRKLGQQMRGELDWIVMKSLEKDRNRRYESASALAADVQRYLQDEPVEACPPSRRYRVGKFLRKYRMGVLTAAALLAAAAVLAGSLGYVVSDRANRLAKIEQHVGEALAGARTGIEANNLTLASQRAAEARRHLINDGDRLPALGAEINRIQQEIESRQADEARLRQFLELISDAQHTMSFNNGADGFEIAKKALDLYGILEADEWRTRLDNSYLTVAQKEQIRETAYIGLLALADWGTRWHSQREDPKRVELSLELLKRAEAFHEPTRAFYFVRREYYRIRGNSAAADEDGKRFEKTAPRTAWDYFLPGHTAGWMGDLQEAIRSYKAALRLQPNHYDSLYFLAMRLGRPEINGDLEAVIAYWSACIALRPEDGGPYAWRASCYAVLGQLKEAESELSIAIPKLKAKLGPDHEDTLGAMNILAYVYGETGRLKEAIALREQAGEKLKVKLGPDHSVTLSSMDDLAKAYGQAGRLYEAVELSEQAVEKRKAKLGPDHPETLNSMNRLAYIYAQTGKLDQADHLLRDSLERTRKKDGPKALDTANVLAMLGSNLLMQQRYVEAEPLLRECLAIRDKQLPDHWARFNTMSRLGGALLGQRRYPAAEPLLLEGYGGMKQRETKIPPHGKLHVIEAIERIVRLYEATEQAEKTRTWREKLPASKSTMREEMRDRSLDTDFNGVRDATALAKLPEAERQEWRKLWQEVEELRQRAAEKR